MADNLDSVKTLAKSYRSGAGRSRQRDDEASALRQEGTAVILEAVAEELATLRRQTMPVPTSYGDLSDLPEALLKELSGLKADEIEQQLLNIVKGAGGEIDLDTILIEYFRRHEEVQTRKFVQNKLWRMAQKYSVESVAGRKGVYVFRGEPSPVAVNPFASDLDDDVPF